MSESENKADIVPIRMGRNTGFQFECHKDVSCFTKCCRGIDIILTPYDIIRLKKSLSSLPKSSWLSTPSPTFLKKQIFRW